MKKGHRKPTAQPDLSGRDILNGMVKRTVMLGWQDEAQRLAIAKVLAGLNRLAGLTGGAGGQGAVATAEQVSYVILALTELGGAKEENQPYLLAMLDDLNTFAAATGIWREGAAGAGLGAPGAGRRGSHRRASFEVGYLVRTGRRGQQMLVESREGGRKNFHVNSEDYAAAIKTLSEAEGPLKFDELYNRFLGSGGREVPSRYTLRVILRFWRSLDPSLVILARTRYAKPRKPISGLPFAEAAERAWQAVGRS